MNLPDGTFLTGIKGARLHYSIVGEGAPLLLVHGFLGAGSDWFLVFDAAPPGYSLLVPDLRGHGHSTNPNGAFSFRQCALDLIALLDHLRLERVAAIGVSGGAQVLLHLATMQSHRVTTLVLVSTAPYFPAEAREAMKMMTPDTISDSVWQEMRAKHLLGDEQIKKLYAYGHALKDSYDDVNFTPAYLSTVTARTLIIHGDQDPLYPLYLPFEMFGVIPHANLWIIPERGHAPIFGDLAATFRETVMSFIRDGQG